MKNSNVCLPVKKSASRLMNFLKGRVHAHIPERRAMYSVIFFSLEFSFLINDLLLKVNFIEKSYLSIISNIATLYPYFSSNY